MNERSNLNDNDPLGLRDLPLLEPGEDRWPQIVAALEQQARSRGRLRVAAWLAAAACLVLVVGLVVLRAPGGSEPAPQQAARVAVTDPAADSREETLDDLIALSQMLEQRLRGLRDGVSSMPAQSAAFAAELEDLIARVDGEISYQPDSVDLWGQRVNLLLDLEFIYQHQWESEYGRMAAL